MSSWLTNVQQIIGLTTPPAYALGVIRTFRWLDSRASDEAKTAISNWLQSEQYDAGAVGNATIEMFDRVYTPHLLSWNAFVRSALFTICITIIFVFEAYTGEDSETYLLLNPPNFDVFRDEVLSFGSAVIANVISDYVSLFVVRQLLVSARNRPLFALWIGPVVGISIVGLFNIVISDALLALWFFWSATDDDYLSVLRFVLANNFVVPEWRALSIAACVVHLWLPLFAVSALLLRAVRWMQWFLKDGRQHPYEVIGYLSAAIVLVGTFALRRVSAWPSI